jgi:16S rRNA (uracil1498-N3)-methyltransferase
MDLGRSVRLLVAAPLAAGPIAVAGDDHHYLFRVRRLAVGDALIVFDGEGREADAVVEAVDGERATLAAAAPRHAPGRAGPTLWSLVPLIKGDRMDTALEKLVELGVDHIVPFAAERSVVRLDPARAAERHRRYAAIARAAASQCRTPAVPTVAPIGDLAGALDAVAGCALKLWMSEQRGAAPFVDVVPDGAGIASVAILSGPEGGLTDDEIAAATAVGFRAVSLGPRILRAETAAIAALVAVGVALGDLGGR